MPSTQNQLTVFIPADTHWMLPVFGDGAEDTRSFENVGCSKQAGGKENFIIHIPVTQRRCGLKEFHTTLGLPISLRFQ